MFAPVKLKIIFHRKTWWPSEMYVCLSFVSSDLFSEAICLFQGGYIVYLFTFIQKVSLEVQKDH